MCYVWQGVVIAISGQICDVKIAVNLHYVYQGSKQSLTHYKPGDLVMYGTESSQLDIALNLRVNIQGPYLVLAKLGDLDYRIHLDTKGTSKVVHHDKLKC